MCAIRASEGNDGADVDDKTVDDTDKLRSSEETGSDKCDVRVDRFDVLVNTDDVTAVDDILTVAGTAEDSGSVDRLSEDDTEIVEDNGCRV